MGAQRYLGPAGTDRWRSDASLTGSPVYVLWLEPPLPAFADTLHG